MRQILLDTETTGKTVTDHHRIIDIGCIELNKRRLSDRYFHCYINPQRQSDPSALAIHGLTDEFLSQKSLFKDIVDDFLDFIKGAQLVIHNAAFDLAFLNYELKRLGYPYKEISHYCEILDTLPLARQRHPGQRNSLDALCKRYGVNLFKRSQYHGALLDAELLGKVYLLMTSGQANLFHETSNKLVNQPCPGLSTQPYAQSEKPPHRVIYANSEELDSHQALLKNIKTLSGHCLWLEK